MIKPNDLRSVMTNKSTRAEVLGRKVPDNRERAISAINFICSSKENIGIERIRL